MARRLTDEGLADAIRRAKARELAAARTEPRARSVRYDVRTRRIELELRNGCSFAVPVASVEGLSGASPKALSDVQLLGDGYALRWEALDVDYTVPGLVAGRLGSRRWMAGVLGASGGRAKSAAKARASRENGRKGGRPRKE